MAKRLYGIANITSEDAILTSTESDNDTTSLKSGEVVRTGGADGDYCHIPKCSALRYFNAHHLSVIGNGSLNFAVWTNDEQNYQLYYSPDGKFDSGVAIPESSYWNDVTMLIDRSDPVKPAKVSFFPY